MSDTFNLIRDYCGGVCDTTIGPSGRGKYFDVVEKHIDCDQIFSDNLLEGWVQQTAEEAPPVLEYLVLACIIFFVSRSVRHNIIGMFKNKVFILFCTKQHLVDIA